VKPHEKRQTEEKNQQTEAKPPSPDGLWMQLFGKSCSKNCYSGALVVYDWEGNGVWGFVVGDVFGVFNQKLIEFLEVRPRVKIRVNMLRIKHTGYTQNKQKMIKTNGEALVLQSVIKRAITHCS
jgi:hypothetical protein